MMPRNLAVYTDRMTDPSINLAREDELFAKMESGDLTDLLRVWKNSECLVRGHARSQRYGWFRPEVAAKLGIPVFERSSGGGVVFHDLGNLNWSFFLKTGGKFLAPKAAFALASKPIVDALNSLGIRAGFYPPNRIDVEGAKVSGMAARSSPKTLLVHGTLLIDSSLERLNAVCIPPEGCPPVSNLRRWSPNLDASKVTKAIVRNLEDGGSQTVRISSLK